MEIRIPKTYKSINPIVFELPDFCVLTEKNGSGKSHLLQAIKDKDILLYMLKSEKANFNPEDYATILSLIEINQ